MDNCKQTTTKKCQEHEEQLHKKTLLDTFIHILILADTQKGGYYYAHFINALRIFVYIHSSRKG